MLRSREVFLLEQVDAIHEARLEMLQQRSDHVSRCVWQAAKAIRPGKLGSTGNLHLLENLEQTVMYVFFVM